VRTEECDKTQSVKVMKSLGIDSVKVLSCVDTKGEELISASSALAQELGVTGSPTLVINGVKANVARTAEAYKIAVCNAFNTAPKECETVLNSTSEAASGNC
jgi:protein-disulfide isomerase